MLYIPNDGLLISGTQKHCSGSRPPRDLYCVQRVTKEIVRNDDDDDATREAEVAEKKKSDRERTMAPAPSFYSMYTEIYGYLQSERAREGEEPLRLSYAHW